jgi:hypothetical protein
MPQDITGSIDLSAIVDTEQIDAADVTTPLNNFITVINAMLNGTQEFDAIDMNGVVSTSLPDIVQIQVFS